MIHADQKHGNRKVTAAGNPSTSAPTPDPTAPRHPEFAPPGEQQTRHDPAKGPQQEVPPMPSIVHEIPEKPANPQPQPSPVGPDPERA